MQPIEVEIDGVKTQVYKVEDVEADTKGLKITLENLKTEKAEALEKLKEAKDAASSHEVALAEAKGDKERVEQLMAEAKAAKDKEHGELIATIKAKEKNAFIDSLVLKHGAGGAKNEDLRDLLRARYDIDYDIKDGAIKVSGSGVTNAEDLQKLVAESELYAGYRAGSGAAGGGALGNNGTGVTNKKFNELTGQELSDLRKQDPGAYDKLKKDYYG